METTYANMTEFEKALKDLLGNKEFAAWYQKMVPLVESGRGGNVHRRRVTIGAL